MQGRKNLIVCQENSKDNYSVEDLVDLMVKDDYPQAATVFLIDNDLSIKEMKKIANAFKYCTFVVECNLISSNGVTNQELLACLDKIKQGCLRNKLMLEYPYLASLIKEASANADTYQLQPNFITNPNFSLVNLSWFNQKKGDLSLPKEVKDYLNEMDKIKTLNTLTSAQDDFKVSMRHASIGQL